MKFSSGFLILAMVVLACGPEVSARTESSTKSASSPVVGDSAAAGGTAVTPAPASAPALLPAVLFSDLDAETAARIDGVVREVRVELGDTVREGDVMLVLDDARGEA